MRNTDKSPVTAVVLLTVICASAAVGRSAEAAACVPLVENAVARCRVVVAADASKPEKFGAEKDSIADIDDCVVTPKETL